MDDSEAAEPAPAPQPNVFEKLAERTHCRVVNVQLSHSPSDHHGITLGPNLLIRAIRLNSLASEHLIIGDQLLAVNGELVYTLDDAEELLDQMGTLEIAVLRPAYKFPLTANRAKAAGYRRAANSTNCFVAYVIVPPACRAGLKVKYTKGKFVVANIYENSIGSFFFLVDDIVFRSVFKRKCKTQQSFTMAIERPEPNNRMPLILQAADYWTNLTVIDPPIASDVYLIGQRECLRIQEFRRRLLLSKNEQSDKSNKRSSDKGYRDDSAKRTEYQSVISTAPQGPPSTLVRKDPLSVKEVGSTRTRKNTKKSKKLRVPAGSQEDSKRVRKNLKGRLQSVSRNYKKSQMKDRHTLRARGIDWFKKKKGKVLVNTAKNDEIKVCSDVEEGTRLQSITPAEEGGLGSRILDSARTFFGMNRKLDQEERFPGTDPNQPPLQPQTPPAPPPATSPLPTPDPNVSKPQ
ncbi:unnamed protein product [Bursaphelenchus xylophilus]|uniref:(pine wood nematode) hypothetical protein n=1 Tax=Bursaphelenchus xylophilus TaxID=6326 RepID=A0A7I8WP10_BURXY|nr:unnamed protein product [Bursaphelenchus xylophilus]CAG9093848.1 unnamed protein product [Bursaphelenchus xylophilus]